MPNLFLEHRMKMIQQRITPPLAGCIVTLIVRGHAAIAANYPPPPRPWTASSWRGAGPGAGVMPSNASPLPRTAPALQSCQGASHSAQQDAVSNPSRAWSTTLRQCRVLPNSATIHWSALKILVTIITLCPKWIMKHLLDNPNTDRLRF